MRTNQVPVHISETTVSGATNFDPFSIHTGLRQI